MTDTANRLHFEGANDLPDLSRTAAALAEFDRVCAEGDAIVRREGCSMAECDVEIERMVEAGRVVAEAYGEDTADRNDPETCASLLWPGEVPPPAGEEPSFIRRMVQQWRVQA